MVSFYLTLILLLTDFYGKIPFRDEVGWALFSVVVLTVTVNLIKAVVLDGKRLSRFIKVKFTFWNTLQASKEEEQRPKVRPEQMSKEFVANQAGSVIRNQEEPSNNEMVD